MWNCSSATSVEKEKRCYSSGSHHRQEVDGQSGKCPLRKCRGTKKTGPSKKMTLNNFRQETILHRRHRHHLHRHRRRRRRRRCCQRQSWKKITKRKKFAIIFWLKASSYYKEIYAKHLVVKTESTISCFCTYLESLSSYVRSEIEPKRAFLDI